MTEQQFIDITAWQNKTFGQSTALAKMMHLKEEIDEVIIDLVDYNPAIRLEFADCMMLLFGAMAACGMTYQDVCKALDEKHQINLNRVWGKPDKNGVVHHIKTK